MDRSEQFWDKNANGYDREEMKDITVRSRILEKIKKYLRKTDHVLDYGCATGILANEIAIDVNTVHGIDISHKMIQIAQTKAGERRIRNVSYARATIFDEGHQAEAFDVVLGIYILHLLDDMPEVLRCVNELLKPGGLFISVTPCVQKKSFAGIALFLVSKIDLIPKLRLFNILDLKRSISDADFEILETECLQQRGRQYFVVAKKGHIAG